MDFKYILLAVVGGGLQGMLWAIVSDPPLSFLLAFLGGILWGVMCGYMEIKNVYSR